MHIKIRALLLNIIAIPVISFSTPPSIKVVEVTKAQLQHVIKTINLVGTIKANKESTLFAQVDGYIDIIEEVKDQFIKKNQIIAQLVNQDLKHQFELAQSAEHIAHLNYQRIQKLTQTHTASLAALEEMEQKWIQAKIALNNTKQQLDKTIIKAPFDGQLGPFIVTEGAMVKMNEKLVTIYDISSYSIELNLPGHVLQNITINQEIKANNNTAKVTEVQKALDPTTHTGIIRAKLSKCDNCLVGQTIDVIVPLHQKEKVLSIANEAIFLQNNMNYVYTVSKNNKIVLTPIAIGIVGDIYTEIKSGLTTSDIVVLYNPSRLWPDLEVKIQYKNT